jgi:hypothetical protein
VRLSFKVKLFLLIVAAQILICAQTPIAPPRVGMVDYYGFHKITPERVQRVLATKPGDLFPHSKGDVEERIEKIPGVLRSHLEAVCCDDGKVVLFVGIEEKGAPHFGLRSEPSTEIYLPADVVDTYHQFLASAESAAHAGITGEDLRSGHALMADEATREIQEHFIEIAARDLPLLKNVLKNSADFEHRAIAAYIIGYAPRKRDVVPDLLQAMQDADDSVRNNAMRALSAIAVLATLRPDLEIQISPTWYVEMLNSVLWSDRTKAVATLLNLTDSRPERILLLLRERALPSLAEMARWKSLTHAVGPYMLLGRVAGMTDQQIEESWTKGEREIVIAKALKSARK